MGDDLVTADELQKRYHISNVTLWRWSKNPTLGFPVAIQIGRRRLWKRTDLAAWEAQRAEMCA